MLTHPLRETNPRRSPGRLALETLSYQETSRIRAPASLRLFLPLC